MAEARVQPLDPYSYDADRFLVAASGRFSARAVARIVLMMRLSSN